MERFTFTDSITSLDMLHEANINNSQVISNIMQKANKAFEDKYGEIKGINRLTNNDEPYSEYITSSGIYIVKSSCYWAHNFKNNSIDLEFTLQVWE